MERAARLTKTQEDQLMVEQHVRQIYETFYNTPRHDQIAKSALDLSQILGLEILRDEHVEYLTNGLRKLGPSFAVLDANRPWLCYWILHSIAILGESVDDQLKNDAVDFLNRCQDPNGGYSGGPGQMPHLATTYAAVNSLITLGGHRSLSSINRLKLRTFLMRMKDDSGGFRMHDGGEVDVRACYTAISVASILNILDDELIADVGNYIVSCQTYEGGIAGEPWSEAHGGYTFCGLATMVLINEVDRLDLPILINWVVFRQGVEGGFQGRTNKLVDGCYSFWQGGVAAIIQRLHLIVGKQLGLANAEESDTGSVADSTSSDVSEGEEHDEMAGAHIDKTYHLNEQGHANACYPASLTSIGHNFVRGHISMKPIFNSIFLQHYILLCSQVNGGFRDKPGKGRDHYHSCYCLSGLSICQYSSTQDADSPPLTKDVVGTYSNLLAQVHPLYNIVLERYFEARQFFSTS